MLILGIDPGYATVGFGFVRYNAPRFAAGQYGAIITPAGDPFEKRLETIYDSVCTLIDRNHPDAVAVEKLYYANNAKTVIGVAEARGVILLAARQKGVPIYEYTPLQVKQAVTGYGQAFKAQVQEMTRRLLCLKSVPKPDDTADALAIAICHAQNYGRRRVVEPRLVVPPKN
ncbi:MAG: crossover junction endodeoxyribonuclease RuvC [Ruminococcaceae bacterium]|nr:crossover junction endodeoxyribonuclease RuvC [Oscillospiraceae bacterium]